jgi:predicted TIM-barrel fold metal-dependent hydrolase
VSRRAFARALLAAPIAFLAGCRLPLSAEQGLYNACRSGIEPIAEPLVKAAWEGIRPERVWDVHAHVYGNGRGKVGIFVGPELDRPATPGAMARREFFMNGGCVGADDDGLDQRMVARLVRLAGELPAGARVMLLAFDATYDTTGRRRDEITGFNVPNDYVRALAAAQPDRFEWIASVHPYREDAIAELQRCKAGGARAVKWLPSAMGIDPSSPRCAPFYDAMKRLDIPLLTHAGDEQAVPGAREHLAVNPLHLRHPLESGVRVITAHCATLGEGADLDVDKNPDKAPAVPNFELFARLMAERRYEGLLFGDLSAVTQLNRLDWLAPLLMKREWDGRLLNGSDYPLPGILPLFSLGTLASEGFLDEALVPGLKSLRESNALLFDFVLKRNLRVGSARLPASAFETRDFFLRTPSPLGEGRGEG